MSAEGDESLSGEREDGAGSRDELVGNDVDFSYVGTRQITWRDC